MTDLDEEMQQFQAQLACTRFHDYTILVAIERARKFARCDMATRDAQGNLIVFGQSYTHERDGKLHRVDVSGLDLRNHGWVFVWDGEDRSSHFSGYDAVRADRLTPVPEETT